MALLQILRPTLPILIGASLMLTLSMGLRQTLRHFHAAADAGHRDFGVGFHAGAGGAKSRLGISAAVRRRADGALRLSAIMMVGALLYVAGLALMATAHGMISAS